MPCDEIRYLEQRQQSAYTDLRRTARRATNDARLALNPRRLLRGPRMWIGAGALVIGVSALTLVTRRRSKTRAVPKCEQVSCGQTQKARPRKDSGLSAFLIGMIGRWMIEAAPLALNWLLYPPSTRQSAQSAASTV